ncbi:hypothetical protein [Acetobacter thailandicus]|uniref:hypothetical protein n=1 Tax=Acetobacter thailandicus TaxID=1502842 RepID=UPI001BAC9DFC|nr:hypothetical protein [Acetobacter thailandicus]MBS1003207.1 hypothetical protein [Acetobacter thailandicus]
MSMPTKYGFKWGACELSRLCSHNKNVFIELKTDRASIYVHVTPSGLLRIQQISGSYRSVKVLVKSPKPPKEGA